MSFIMIICCAPFTSVQCALAQAASGNLPTLPAAECPPAIMEPDDNPVIRRIETGIMPALTGETTRPQSLANRMRVLNVPGVSVAMMRGGRIDWVRAWGVRDAGTCSKIDPTTIFQAASISKSVTALLAMRLVELGKLDLDEDVNVRLRRWNLPQNPRFPYAHVTLRQLLSHTGGIGVHGFTGYLPDAPMPDLLKILNGQPPANSPPVRLEASPGVGFDYSGGGYMIVQALIEDVTGRSFAYNARNMVLKPLRMSRSDFTQPLSHAGQTNASVGHDGGNPFRHHWYVYPELAAAGLWTTPTDLARMLIGVRAAGMRSGHIVSQRTATTMLTTVAGDWGLGFSLSGAGLGRRFGHGGVQLGYLSNAWIDQASGDGIVVMTNGEGGLTLADDITRAVADELHWHDFASRPLTAALAAGPAYVRGSMNDWSTASILTPTGPGLRSAVMPLHSGDYAFKIASEDWKTLVLGGTTDHPFVDAIRDTHLVPGGSDISLKIAVSGNYRFTLKDDGAGTASLSVNRE